MMWVEVLSRHREVVARHRCTGADIRVGRAYDNDIIVDDPYVAAHHVRIVRDADGAVIVEDLGSANGIYADRGRLKLTRVVVDGDRPIRIGHSYLRIRDPDHPVAPERTAISPLTGWQGLLVLGGLTLAVELLALWLGDAAEFKLTRYVIPLALTAIFALIWAALWAVLARVFAGQPQFQRNLQIALAGILAGLLWNELSEYGAFALSWRALAAYEYAGGWCLVAAICFFHLRLISPSHLELKGGVLAAVAGLAVGLQVLVQSELHAGADQEDYVRRLMPPIVRLSPQHEEAAFFADLGQLKATLDEARIKALGAGPEPADSDEPSTR